MTESFFGAGKDPMTGEISLHASNIVENGSHESGTAKALNEALSWMNDHKLETIGASIAVVAGAALGGRALFSLAAKEGYARIATDRLVLDTDGIFASIETGNDRGSSMLNSIAQGMSKEEESQLSASGSVFGPTDVFIPPNSIVEEIRRTRPGVIDHEITHVSLGERLYQRSEHFRWDKQSWDEGDLIHVDTSKLLGQLKSVREVK